MLTGLGSHHQSYQGAAQLYDHPVYGGSIEQLWTDQFIPLTHSCYRQKSYQRLKDDDFHDNHKSIVFL